MERRGLYNKGRAGHARNVSPYRMMHEKFKKWRGPVLGALVLMLVFGLAPTCGDVYQASILTAPETPALVKENPSMARKTILDYASGIAKECEQYAMKQCAEQGKLLLADMANEAIDTQTVFNAVVSYEADTLNQRAKAACKYSAAQYMLDLQDAQSKLVTFTDSYGEALAIPDLQAEVLRLKSQIGQVKELVDSCSN